MATRTARTSLGDVAVSSMLLAVVLLLWEGGVAWFDVPSYLLPPPSAVLSTIIADWDLLLANLVITLLEALAGFVLASLVAVIVAVAFCQSPLLARGLYPLAIALKTTPVIAMAPLLVLALGTGFVSKTVVSALVCFFPILVNALKGLTSIETEALELFHTLRATSYSTLLHLRLPKALPFIFSALKVASSLAVVGAVIGEFQGAQKGIGLLIVHSSYHLEITRMYAAIVLLAIAGSIFFAAISLLERRLVFWSPEIIGEGGTS